MAYTRTGRPNGRPSEYTPERAATLCRRIADGETMRQVCRDEGQPDRETVRRWEARRPEFRGLLAHAIREGAHGLADQTIDLADAPAGITDPQVAKALAITARLQVGARQWLASRRNPEAYGDAVQVRGTLEHVKRVVLELPDADGPGRKRVEALQRGALPPVEPATSSPSASAKGGV